MPPDGHSMGLVGQLGAVALLVGVGDRTRPYVQRIKTAECVSDWIEAV